MCWFGYIKNRRVAKEDIKVFKMLYREPDSWKKLDKGFVHIYRPPFYGGIYKLGEKREITSLGVQPIGKKYNEIEGKYEYTKFKIEEGLHCYSLEKCKRSWGNQVVIVYNDLRGTIQRYPREDKERIVKPVLCIIPKGAVYWENDYGEIVTNELIPIKEL